jgi:hypothetical protein
MAKFANKPTAVPSAVKTTATTPNTLTHEGAPAYTREAKGELFVTALTSLISENSFYEDASTRDQRLVHLVDMVTKEDPEWMQAFLPWLRREGFMRSAPVMLAAEYVKSGGPQARSVVASVLRRPDEPGEMLAYWMSRYGRNIPQPVKRGVADAVQRLYNERSLLKYDGQGQTWRFGDVIEVVHPKPTTDWQSDLYKYALDRRRHSDAAVPESLAMVRSAVQLNNLAEDARRTVTADQLKEAGFTWERLSGWMPGGMDADAWEKAIPSMGYMARLRNLRNFDQAGVSPAVAKAVAEHLASPVPVAKSMQFPFRFYNAWQAATGLSWAPALETALQLSTSNIPELYGRSLVIVDTSGSMTMEYSKRGQMDALTAATLFGAALYAKNPTGTDLVWATTSSGPIPYQGSVLRTIDWVHSNTKAQATYLGKAMGKHYNGQDRIFLFTDGQFHDRLPQGIQVPTYFFNLSAYKSIPAPVGQGHYHELAGLSDATFRLIPLLEMGKAGLWPWELDNSRSAT